MLTYYYPNRPSLIFFLVSKGSPRSQNPKRKRKETNVGKTQLPQPKGRRRGGEKKGTEGRKGKGNKINIEERRSRVNL